MGVIVMVVVLALHLLLACGFMPYFIHVPAVAAGSHNTTQSIVTPAVNIEDQALGVKENEAEKSAVVESGDSKSEEKRSNKPASASEENGGNEQIEEKESLKGDAVVDENKK